MKRKRVAITVCGDCMDAQPLLAAQAKVMTSKAETKRAEGRPQGRSL